VTEPKPTRSAGPDWGRMVSAMLVSESANLGGFQNKAQVVLDRDGLPTILYESNAEPKPGSKGRYQRKDPDWPYYRVEVHVIARSGKPDLYQQQETIPVDKSISWSGPGGPRRPGLYDVKRLGIGISIVVDSDDAKFEKEMNELLDREITRVLSAD
jgi:hypothetical protein